MGLVQDQVKGRRVDRQGRPEVLAGPDRNSLPEGPEPLQQLGDLLVLLGAQLLDPQGEAGGGACEQALQAPLGPDREQPAQVAADGHLELGSAAVEPRAEFRQGLVH